MQLASANGVEKERVLVVDDEPQVLVALEDLLSDEYVVVKCNSAESALRAAEDVPNLAVVLSDQRMPNMTGDRLLAELERVSDASRVLVTGYSDLTAVVRAVNDGRIFAYVHKPWEPSALKLTVDRAAEYCRLHRELLRERCLLVDLMDSVSDGIYVKDQELKFQRVNRAYVDMLLDHSPGHGAVVGRRLSDVWQGPDAHKIEQDEAAVLERQKPIADVLSRRRREGGVRWYSKSLAPLCGPDGAVSGVVGVVRDVTERAEMLEALEASEERQRLVIEAAEAGLFDWNQVSGHVLYSPEFARLLGEEPEALAASFSSVAERVHPDDAEAALAALEPASGEGQRVKRLELRLRMATGEYRWFQLNAKVRLGDNEKPRRLVGAIQDVTEWKEQQERIAILSRVRAVLGEVNGAIARVRDPADLLERVCEIASRTGGIPLALVCDHDETRTARVTAADGQDEDLLASVRANEGRGTFRLDGAFAAPLRAGQPVLVNDPELMACGPVGSELIRLGYRSLAGAPVMVGGKLQHTIVLVSKQPGFFDTQEVALLEELAANVAFGLEHAAKSRRLDTLLSHDELTGLSRRELFVDRLQQRMAASDSASPHLAVVWLDLNRFRHVNETFGRVGGDSVLRQVASRLVRVMADDDRVARVDANAFALISPPLPQASAVAEFLSRVRREAFDTPFEVDGSELRLSATVGVAMFPDDGEESEALLFQAETAGKTARGSGQPYLFYAPTMNERVAEKLAMETRLRRAIQNLEFVLHYQPKIDLNTGAVTGLEALVRWNDPEKGLIPPGAFIPLLEETGLILDVGRWVLFEAVRQQAAWQEAGANPPRIAVNVSAVQLAHDDFVSSLRQVVEAYPDAAKRLDIEITESVVMGEFEANVEKLRLARSVGLGIALDDFGTGYSSLGYLRRLPTDAVKVDRSFVSRMDQSAADMAIVSTVISLAHSLGLKVIAEGVETTNQAHLLRLLRCDELQGFLIAKPLPAEQVVSLFGETYTFDTGGRAIG